MVLYLHPQSASRNAQLKATKGALAQLVEQRTENPCVPGSIPGGTTLKNPLIEWVFCFYSFPTLSLFAW